MPTDPQPPGYRDEWQFNPPRTNDTRECLSAACATIGETLWTTDRFIRDAIHWLSRYAAIELEWDTDSWIVRVAMRDDPPQQGTGGDSTLELALCSGIALVEYFLDGRKGATNGE